MLDNLAAFASPVNIPTFFHKSGVGPYLVYSHPKAHQKYLKWIPSRLIRWAGQIGSQTQKLVVCILENRPHPEQDYPTHEPKKVNQYLIEKTTRTL